MTSRQRPPQKPKGQDVKAGEPNLTNVYGRPMHLSKLSAAVEKARARDDSAPGPFRAAPRPAPAATPSVAPVTAPQPLPAPEVAAPRAPIAQQLARPGLWIVSAIVVLGLCITLLTITLTSTGSRNEVADVASLTEPDTVAQILDEPTPADTPAPRQVAIPVRDAPVAGADLQTLRPIPPPIDGRLPAPDPQAETMPIRASQVERTTAPQTRTPATIAFVVVPNPPASGLTGPTALASASASAVPPLAQTSSIRLMLHYTRGLSAAGLARLDGVLGTAGLGSDSQIAVPFRISKTNVRYYHKEDAEAASEIAQALRPETETTLRDFTGYTPRPEPGYIEIWLATGYAR